MASRRPSRLAAGVTDAAVYSSTGSQELTSILNAPESSTPSTWLAWPFTAASSHEAPPPLPPGTLPEVRMEDFARYLRTVGDKYDGFEHDRTSSEDRVRRNVTLTSEEVRSSQGQGLVTALREVPAVYFQESFDLDRPEVWGLLGDVDSEEGRQEALEKLGHYLDVVETHLVREIAARSDNFFDASGYIQDLRGRVFGMYQEVATLRAKMSRLEQESGVAVRVSERLQRQRSNVLAALDALRAVEEVAQAQAALQGLLPQAAGGGGMAADFVAAIDVLEVLQAVLDNQDLLALDCFRTLPQQIAETAQAVDDLMATDFLERARFGGEGAATSRILQRLAAQLAAAQTPRGGEAAGAASPRGRLYSSGEGPAGGGGAEAVAGVRLADQAALDLVAAWVEGSGQQEAPLSAASAGTGELLEDVLLPLVMGMRRMGRLSAALKDFRDVSSAGMRDLIRRVVDDCLGVLAPGPSDSMHLVVGQAGSPPGRASSAELLQQLPGEHFQWVLEAVLLAVRAYLNHVARMGAAVQSVLSAAKAPRQQLTAAAGECREVCQAVAEVAIGRWAKLLSGRAHAGAAAAARLSELREVLDVTDVAASLAEGQGVKPALALRSAVQQLCKASLDALHNKTLGKLTSLLEQEHWSLVEVPLPFQQVVDKLQARGQQAAAGTAQPQPQPQQPQQPQAHSAPGQNGSATALAAAAAPAAANGAAAGGEEDGGGAAAAGLPGQQPQQHAEQAAQQVQHGDERQVQRKYTITPQVEPGGAHRPTDVLVIGGQRYHVVNTALLLLNMLGDYLAFREAVPAFVAEVAQRVLELLKIFNSRTCQLVLGAGAMQVSGLKSITAKHLAISCQCLGVFIALHPALTAVFTHAVPQPRRDLLAADFTRTVQDYIIHRDEICSKLVFIMRERLSMNLKQLPTTAATWPSGPLPPAMPQPPPLQQQQQLQQQGQQEQGGLQVQAGGTGAGAGAWEGLPLPSAFAATNVRQLQILSGVLAPLLLPEEAHSIFSRVALMFSTTLVEAFGLLEPRGPAWELQLQADVLALLECLEQLPMEPAQRDTSLERLRLFCKQRFESRPQPQQPEQQPEQQREAELQPGTPSASAAEAEAEKREAGQVEDGEDEVVGAQPASPPSSGGEQEEDGGASSLQPLLSHSDGAGEAAAAGDAGHPQQELERQGSSRGSACRGGPGSAPGAGPADSLYDRTVGGSSAAVAPASSPEPAAAEQPLPQQLEDPDQEASQPATLDEAPSAPPEAAAVGEESAARDGGSIEMADPGGGQQEPGQAQPQQQLQPSHQEEAAAAAVAAAGGGAPQDGDGSVGLPKPAGGEEPPGQPPDGAAIPLDLSSSQSASPDSVPGLHSAGQSASPVDDGLLGRAGAGRVRHPLEEHTAEQPVA